MDHQFNSFQTVHKYESFMAGKLCNAIVGFDDDIISFWNDVIALRYAMTVRGTPTSTNHCTHLQESYVETLDKDVTERQTCCVVDDDLWCLEYYDRYKRLNHL